MSAPHYVVYVNGIELLEKALASLEPIRQNVIVVDNRDVFTQQPPVPLGYETLKPEFPMNQAQLLTWLALKCKYDAEPWFTWSHHDSVSVDNTIVRLRETAALASATYNGIGLVSTGWGLIFTQWPQSPDPWNHVDTMCAVNVGSVLSVGGWDWYRFPDYFSDYDLYGKLAKSGYAMIQSGLPIDHLQGGSMTAATDGNRALVKALKWPAYQALWDARRQELGLEWPPR